MGKSRIQFLIINFFLVVLCLSCATNSVVTNQKVIETESNSFYPSYFSNSEIDYVYKANISVYGNELSGIFIAKKISDSTHRVVFTTEFGNKLLDFEISENEFKVNSIVPELDRKILINTLKTDFKLLLKSQFKISESYKGKTELILKSLDKNKYNFVILSSTDNKLTNIIHASKRKQKINISFSAKNNTFAEQIVIQHYNLDLKIVLSYFK
ncbi:MULTISPECIES: hypothetical protein [Flavobacterium]|uniref:Lipoprotein n=1 Tax=Flavobacterium jumunjinense TaxID=998845 RepID=A0ABV5GKM8_9FLAO|nr:MULTISPECIES: hypothetical protein [Flavobacterium]